MIHIVFKLDCVFVFQEMASKAPLQQDSIEENNNEQNVDVTQTGLKTESDNRVESMVRFILHVFQIKFSKRPGSMV